MKVRGGRITKPKYITWWMFAVVAFLIFVLLQIPAAWLIAKFYKNNQVLHNVSGNIWHGQADWQTGKLRGTVLWTTRPLDLLLLRAGTNLEIYSANTKLEGVLVYGFGRKIMVRDLNGQIAPETLKSLANWQWPSNAIQLQEIDFNYKKEQGFDQVDGGIQWAGGELMYIFAQRPQQMQIPSLAGRLSQEQNKLMVDLRDQRQQKLMNLTIDPSLMLDVQLTQRLMLNVPSYQGKAGLDSYVVSSRQPLLSGGF